MTVVAGSGRTEKQEAIIEPGDDLLDRHGAQPHGGEFEGERDAVQPAAQLDHWLLIRGGEREPGHHRFRPDRRLGDSGILTPRPGPGRFPGRGPGRWLRRAG